MTQLRILRTNFRWQIVQGHEIHYGGQNPVELVYDEKLQYAISVCDENNVISTKWVDVPIVEEGEKPEHPRQRRRPF